MARFSLLFPLALLAGCSQPPSAVDMRSASPAGQQGAQGIPGDTAARCAEANWKATGYRHGLSGYPLSALGQVSKACVAAGAKVDRLAYSTGRLEGLTEFCSAENGYRRARAGHPVDNPCPPTLAAKYASGHARGMAER